MNVSMIDTRHGTDNQYSFSHGNCLPYTGVPFGMNFFAPQTSNQRGSWWFHPEDRTFQGFRITHQPSPWMGDFSHMTLLPLNGAVSELSLFHAQSSYRPEESCFNPAYLNIKTQRYQSTGTLVPSMYGGLLAIENCGVNPGLGLSFPGTFTVKQIDAQTIAATLIVFSGCEDDQFTFHFVCKFASSIVALEGPLSGEEGFVIVRFKDEIQEAVHFATSFISEEQAFVNLQREANWTLADYKASATDQWNDYLSRIELTHHDQKQVSTFYHNFYRLFLFPQTFYEIDADGRKVHWDTLAKTVKSGPLYTNNGFWDTYKTVYPLFSLIAVEKLEEMLEGFLNSYRESGFLPKWLSPDERGLMPGTLIDAVIADAAVKGIRPDLMPELLTAMKKAATQQSENSNYGRQGTLDYLTYGYVPLDYHESVNHTLDYCYSDFCISQVGKQVADTEIAHYQKQSLNYQHIFDPETGFMRAKDKEGRFRPDFNQHRWGKDYAEGSAWQSSFAVYHDFAGLINAHGGEERFEAKLIDLCNQDPQYTTEGYGFEIHEMSEMAAIDFGQLAISNQPSFHYPYLFSYIGKPEMAQPLIKQLLTQCFDDSPKGFPGDEDNGSMAGWYLFNALGFYPVTPGSGEYVIGMPLFDQATIKLSSGKILTIQSTPNKPQQLFVDAVTLNHAPVDKMFFTHQELIAGGSIDFKLGVVPRSRTWSKDAYPFSLSNRS
ncbi:GH92 family glycosyl hydrolase [Enterococcus sp.]|uniref:GH92 family glycosyl hydrolase n=1 Tax=Enterococcus sp. TaxID=35783 RepID=UPI002899EF52|nr:GH92 family glycosyl hydrolase [Enterococcus sp.]